MSMKHQGRAPVGLSALLVAGFVALATVVAFAVDPERNSQAGSDGPLAADTRPAILRGRVTDEAGVPLADVRVRVAIPAADMRFVDVGTPHEKVEARSDAEGNYRLVLPTVTGKTTVSIDAMKPGYRRLVGTLMAGGDAKERRSRAGGGGGSRPDPQARALFRRRGRRRTRQAGSWGRGRRGSSVRQGLGRGREDRDRRERIIRDLQLPFEAG